MDRRNASGRPPDSFVRLLGDGERFLLTGHEHPDGDCVGAQVALYHLLTDLGKSVTICNPDPPSPTLDFLAAETPFSVFEPNRRLDACDVVVLLDCAEPRRLGAMLPAVEAMAAKLAIVDHHVGSADVPADAHYVDADAPSTGALVYRLFRHFGRALPEPAATGVFISLVADTGWFRYSNTTAEVFQMAAELVQNGVSADRVYDLLHRRNHPDSVPFLAQGLTRGNFSLGGRFGWALLDMSSVERAAKMGFDLDQVMEPLRSVRGIEVVALLKEMFDGRVKASLRSQGDVDVQRIARRFGGGGHQKAAGAVLDGPLQAAQRAIEAEVETALRAFGERGR